MHLRRRSGRYTGVVRWFIVLGLAAATACGGTPPALDVPPSFPGAPLVALDSDTGALHIELRSFPEPPVRGQNVGQFTVTDASGQPVPGLTLAVLPWMPAHGHGTSVQAVVAPSSTEMGVFVANPLYLFMSGQWELRMTFDGDVHDTATALVEIP
jgi:hypothetical protein